MTPRTWAYGQVEGEDDLTEDLSLRDRTYESFGQQGLAMPTYLPEPYEAEEDRLAPEHPAEEPPRGAERVDLGEPLVSTMQDATRLRARDERLHDEICDRLKECNEVDDSEFEVIVHEGEVTLSGAVSDGRQRARAVAVVDRVRGVVDVANRLHVGLPASGAEEDEAPPSTEPESRVSNRPSRRSLR